MDIFDQYLFEELVSVYERSSLTDDDYEELYIRFCSHDHIEEIKPYIYTMRFFGLGTASEPDEVLAELKACKSENSELRGLYYDLLLCENADNTGAANELRRAIKDGYCDRYLQKKSNVGRVEKKQKKETCPPKNTPTHSRKETSQTNTPSVEYNALTKDVVESLLCDVKKADYGTRSLTLPSTYNKIGAAAFQGIKDIDMLIIPNGFIKSFKWQQRLFDVVARKRNLRKP